MLALRIHLFILVRIFIVKTICCNFYPLIQLVYLSIKMLTDVTLFRMAPPTRLNPERNDGSQANPPPPPPPPEAWQALMAATNAKAQMMIQLMQNFYCEDYMLQFLSVDSTCLSVYQDANGCHPLQDGSANASESGTQ